MESLSSESCDVGEAVNGTVDSVFASHGAVIERAHHWAPYSNRDELVDEICDRLREGEALNAICRDPRMPSVDTVMSWAQGDEQVGSALARARDIGHDSIALDALEIADDKRGDPQRDKLRIDTRLKLLAKWNPKKYGEGLQLRHADADGGKLDTAPLVSELLGLMMGHNGNTQAQAPVAARLVSEAPAHLERQAPRVEASAGARPAYRPRVARSDVDDLV